MRRCLVESGKPRPDRSRLVRCSGYSRLTWGMAGRVGTVDDVVKTHYLLLFLVLSGGSPNGLIDGHWSRWLANRSPARPESGPGTPELRGDERAACRRQLADLLCVSPWSRSEFGGEALVDPPGGSASRSSFSAWRSASFARSTSVTQFLGLFELVELRRAGCRQLILELPLRTRPRFSTGAGPWLIRRSIRFGYSGWGSAAAGRRWCPLGFHHQTWVITP